MTDDAKKAVILLVDDDHDLREIMATKLKAAGWEVVEAEDGESGLIKAIEIMPDLMILDINMPKMSGMQVFSKMKGNAILSKLKVIFMTSYGEPEKEAAWLDKKFAKEIGALDYIKKGEDLNKVVEEVRNILNPS